MNQVERQQTVLHTPRDQAASLVYMWVKTKVITLHEFKQLYPLISMTPLKEYNGDVIVHEWPGWYLRDDLATGCRDPEQGEAYSLFRFVPYGREGVYAGRLEWAIKECTERIERS